ncbi:MAG: hypothetical protein AAGC84_01035 [Pseudomonas sp.]
MKLPAIALAAFVGLTLSGCEVAEDSAQKLTDKAGQVAKELAQETLNDTVQALNEKIDQAQQSSKELLGKPTEEKPEEPAKPDSKPAPSEGIET